MSIDCRFLGNRLTNLTVSLQTAERRLFAIIDYSCTCIGTFPLQELLRRSSLDSPVSFERSWADYVQGFGDPGGDQWVGLGYASRQMGRRKHTLRVDLAAENGTEAHTVYYGFTLFETGTGGYKIRYDAIAPESDAGESIGVFLASAYDFVAHLYN